MRSLVLFTFLGLRSVLAINNTPQVGDSVQTTSGLVNGHEAPWPKNSGVSEYLGIPFAEPPLGQLRFAAPQTYKPRGPISGAEFAPGCLQGIDPGDLEDDSASSKSTFSKTEDPAVAYTTGMGDDVRSRNYSEDCLALNIWAKPGNKGKAVMIWIYGGDLITNPLSYRIGVFGFPGAPTLPDQNVGLLDQRKGIEWLRDNIEQFGGDPKRMTLFGESAGGASVDFYSFAWTKDPIINAFILQSGTAGLMISPPNDPKDSNWYKFTHKLGCGKFKDGAKTVDCMRSLPAATVLSQFTMASPTPDGKVVFSDYAKRAEEGNFIKRPLLIGNLDKEGDLFPALMKGMAKSYGKSKGGSIQSLVDGVLSFIDRLQSSFSGFGGLPKGLDRLSCGPATVASARSKAGVPTWRYRWYGKYPNLEVYPGLESYHSMDVPFVFGATERTSSTPNTPEEAQLEKNMMIAWTTFAKDPEHGLEKLGWPLYDPQKPTLVKIGFNNNPNVTFGSSEEYDTACSQ